MNPGSSPLLTDHYQLMMMQSYLEQGMEETAVFELFVRKLPSCRNFMVAAGLEQALDFLENLTFSPDELAWLAPRFRPHFIAYLEQFHFNGDVHAMPEGTLFFPDEPILRITAPLPQAQLVESRIMNLLHFQSMIASKAARSVLTAPDKLLVDFGMRRAHGAEAALLAARASYLAGFSGTATVLAGTLYGIPLFGTSAHSYIQAHRRRSHGAGAFCTFLSGQCGSADRYLRHRGGCRKVVTLARKLRVDGISIKGVRLDSGDLAMHARRVRQILDEGGLENTTIFASGNLDEYRLRALLSPVGSPPAPIDGFGVGTALDVSSDAPSLDCAYKLQEYAGKARRKRSEGKATWPGRKQVYREYDAASGRMARDIVTLEGEGSHGGEPLIVPVMLKGKRIDEGVKLDEIRKRTLASYARLPKPLTILDAASPGYPVEISARLQALATRLDAETGAQSLQARAS